VLEIILLSAFGMDVFDAFCHAFGTMATGGFSNQETSVAAYASLPLEIIIVVFMFIAGGNFSLYYGVLRGQPRRLLRSPEFLTYTGIMAASAVVIAISLIIAKSHFSVGHAFRESLFQVVSVQTTTGFVTADFNLWNSFAKFLLVLLMFVGGSAGSTAGGIKVARVLILAKSSRHELTRQMHPQAVLPLKIGGRVVPESVGRNVLGYLVIYLVVFLTGALLVSMTNVDLITAGTSVAATLNNIGPGLELVGATGNYSFMDPFAKIVLIVMMVVGRLELFAILLPFTRAFWRR
jgi:trk system potassium uptake protein TrkH